MCTKTKKTKQVILWNSPIVCGCIPGGESAFYPTLKNKNSKTFKCPCCGKNYKSSEFKPKWFSLRALENNDQVFISKKIKEYKIEEFDWKSDEYVIVFTSENVIKNSQLELFIAEETR